VSGDLNLRADARAPGLLIGDDVLIDPDASLGAYVVVHAGTTIGAGCVVEDHAVLGKRPRLARGSSASGEVSGLRIERAATVGTGTVVFAGTRIGEEVIVGAQAFVRERCEIGAGSLIGRGTVVENDVILGERVRVQTNVYVTAFTRIEEDVFIGPGAVMTNDNTMARHARGEKLAGPTLKRACRIGGGAVLTPGVEVGEEAFVAAGALVRNDVPARAVVMGVPARVVREVPDEDLLERWR
jgi:UDP-2-acetamido-3-amino-2,3-dideoxy-glucuronate N-acetyltransferase